MVFCTSTLAEGVNLPIRTMVLYSVHRSGGPHGPVPLLVRDIRNLVGRAGRAGSTSRGLVICANDAQWELVLRASGESAGESVEGSLIKLIRRLADFIARNGIVLTNHDLESTPGLQSLVDGIDATLIELLTEELGAEQFAQLARDVIDHTYAARTADSQQVELLREVASLRASRIVDIRDRGRFANSPNCGPRPRMIDNVLDDLWERFSNWETVESSNDPELIAAILGWALSRPEFSRAITDGFKVDEIAKMPAILKTVVSLWLAESTYEVMASAVGMDVNQLLRLHTKLVQFDLLTLVEQAVAVLAGNAEKSGSILASAVKSLPEAIRFGSTSPNVIELMLGGIRHRRAAIELSTDARVAEALPGSTRKLKIREILLQEDEEWIQRFGKLVYLRTLEDVAN